MCALRRLACSRCAFCAVFFKWRSPGAGCLLRLKFSPCCGRWRQWVRSVPILIVALACLLYVRRPYFFFCYSSRIRMLEWSGCVRVDGGTKAYLPVSAFSCSNVVDTSRLACQHAVLSVMSVAVTLLVCCALLWSGNQELQVFLLLIWCISMMVTAIPFLGYFLMLPVAGMNGALCSLVVVRCSARRIARVS